MNRDTTHNGDLTYRIIGLAVRVHRHLGPGLLESAYHRCLSHELSQQGIAFEQQVHLAIPYHGTTIDAAYVADIIVHGEVILELKSVEQLSALHEAQLMTYLRISGCRVGLLINFNTISLIDGIRRRVL